ncbi:MAG: hypothetical protein ACFFG0_02115 [Candidatus Thorarchaeota archaeon]
MPNVVIIDNVEYVPKRKEVQYNEYIIIVDKSGSTTNDIVHTFKKVIRGLRNSLDLFNVICFPIKKGVGGLYFKNQDLCWILTLIER